MKGVLLLIIGVILAYLAFEASDQSRISTVPECKVLDLQQQQTIKGSDGDLRTEIRYLVITDKETFVCENSMLNGKFNNSDIFWRLKRDSVYTFKVCGWGKSIVTDYRNLLEVVTPKK